MYVHVQMCSSQDSLYLTMHHIALVRREIEQRTFTKDGSSLSTD